MSRPRPVQMNTGGLLAGAVFLLAAAFALTPFESHDLWWHLRAGELILRQGRPPAANLFSFTAPKQLWVTHEWLAEALFFWIYSHLGPAALVAGKALLVGTTFTLIYVLACREGAHPGSAAAATAVAAYAARFTFDIRPQLFTYLLLALCLLLIHHHRQQGGRALYALVPAFWLWANLHSGFIAGLGLLALAAVTMPRHARAFLGTLLAATAAALLTPNHWRGLWFPLAVSRTRLFVDTLTEWFSPNFHSSWLWGFEGLLLLCIVVLAVSPLRPRAFELGSLLLFAHLALQHQRHVTLFALAAAPVLARHLTAAAQPFTAGIAWPRAGEIAAAGVAMGLAACLLFQKIPHADAFAASTGMNTFPVAAAGYLAEKAPLRLYNSYRWGGYLIWRLYPAQRVFIDGRADAYPVQVFQDYLRVERLQPDWEAVLDRYRIDAVIYHTGSILGAALRRRPDWKLVYADATAEIFLRRSHAR